MWNPRVLAGLICAMLWLLLTAGIQLAGHPLVALLPAVCALVTLGIAVKAGEDDDP